MYHQDQSRSKTDGFSTGRRRIHVRRTSFWTCLVNGTIERRNRSIDDSIAFTSFGSKMHTGLIKQTLIENIAVATWNLLGQDVTMA
jgi:hypothetical protein